MREDTVGELSYVTTEIDADDSKLIYGLTKISVVMVGPVIQLYNGRI